MKNFIIGKNEAGQRLDKFILKYLSKANKSFIYKMLRKKNITLNDKKAIGSEILAVSDEIKFWLSDETFDKFKTDIKISKYVTNNDKQYSKINFENSRIVYEDENIILYNKPAGVLSQKSTNNDISLNELFISYLIENNKIKKSEFDTFTPSICNRLDRNTSGLIVFGKSFIGLQNMNRLIKNKDVIKEYICIIEGVGFKEGRYKAFLLKDTKTNKVLIKGEYFNEANEIDTEYEILHTSNNKTMLKVVLHTGKTHQIRAHLSFLGFPIIGDKKYGGNTNGINHQLLHSYQLSFNEIDGDLAYLSGKSFIAAPDNIYKTLMKGYIWEHGSQEG